MKPLHKAKDLLTLFLICLSISGLSFKPSKIPLNEIHSGGPPKNGIPALTNPNFVPANKAFYLKDQDRVIGIMLNGEAKAYPLRILNWHEIVNDIVGGSPVLVTFCPLCGTAIVFDPVIKGTHLNFGVSGRLYNSNILFYDRKTESLWSQGAMEAVTGPYMGTLLTPIPAAHTTWAQWKEKFPETLALSDDTGHFRDYTLNPYASYEKNPMLMFPVKHSDNRLDRKDWVAGVIINDQAKAYPYDAIRQAGSITDTLKGTTLHITFDETADSLSIQDKDGNPETFIPSYWFAWAAFYPETEVWSTNNKN